jgi:hypothetical protein
VPFVISSHVKKEVAEVRHGTSPSLDRKVTRYDASRDAAVASLDTRTGGKLGRTAREPESSVVSRSASSEFTDTVSVEPPLAKERSTS